MNTDISYGRWMESRNLADLQKKPTGIAVYRDSFCALRKSVQLFSTYPDIASYVRRVWFDGFRVAETDAYIFQVLRNCRNVRSATLPWTTLRHVSAEDWSLLLQGGSDRQALSSLELLAVDLKDSQIRDPANLRDVRPLDVEHGLDFSSLKRLKIFGNTNLLPITDSDLKSIARTARNLKAIHITGLSSVTIDGKHSAFGSCTRNSFNQYYRSHGPRPSIKRYPSYFGVYTII